MLVMRNLDGLQNLTKVSVFHNHKTLNFYIMNDITTQDPEEILNGTDAKYFIVVWANSQGTFFGTGGGGFQNAFHGQIESPAVERCNAVEEYYALVRTAKSHDMIKDGRIDLVALPMFNS
jgi:hypothetical protein